jgi:tRNA (cytidine/uridine-2'-O-)-methyltransferase
VANSDIHIVLVHPQIPPNTGNVARLCAALGWHMDLVEPMAFKITDASVKRAGLDYWPHVRWKLHDSFESLLAFYPQLRWVAIETSGEKPFWTMPVTTPLGVLFGSETKGLSPAILESQGNNVYSIPMVQPAVRSINLSSSVAMVAGHILAHTYSEFRR